MLKPNASIVKIREQFIDDPVTGLTLIFRVTSIGEGRLHIIGDCLPFGNRDFQFDVDGVLTGTGTGFSNSCGPKA
jgi:hypothetical protein